MLSFGAMFVQRGATYTNICVFLRGEVKWHGQVVSSESRQDEILGPLVAVPCFNQMASSHGRGP